MAQQEAEPYPNAVLIAALMAPLAVIVIATDLSARTRRDIGRTVAISPSPNSWLTVGGRITPAMTTLSNHPATYFAKGCVTD